MKKDKLKLTLDNTILDTYVDSIEFTKTLVKIKFYENIFFPNMYKAIMQLGFEYGEEDNLYYYDDYKFKFYKGEHFNGTCMELTLKLVK